MRPLCIVCVAVCFTATAQLPPELPRIRVQETLHNPEAILSAISTTHEGEVFHMKGAVEIRTGTILLKADQASYNHESGEIEATGAVKVSQTSPLIPHGLSQFGIK
jgi:lipopolysaccharide assembly outer membrane protein LptD (OstA)